MDKPHWEPVLADAEYAEQLREDYRHDAHMSDDEILDKFCGGKKYVILWDHLGDAYWDYVKLADAYLKQKEDIADLELSLAHERYQHYVTCESEGLAWDADIPDRPKDY